MGTPEYSLLDCFDALHCGVQSAEEVNDSTEVAPSSGSQTKVDGVSRKAFKLSLKRSFAEMSDGALIDLDGDPDATVDVRSFGPDNASGDAASDKDALTKPNGLGNPAAGWDNLMRLRREYYGIGEDGEDDSTSPAAPLRYASAGTQTDPVEFMTRADIDAFLSGARQHIVTRIDNLRRQLQFEVFLPVVQRAQQAEQRCKILEAMIRQHMTPGSQLYGGATVRIHGLVSDYGSTLNGTIGTCLDFDRARQRWGVLLLNGAGVAIKPRNLFLLDRIGL